MKAIRINEFGGPEVMQLEEVIKPVPAGDEILIKMYASSVNPADYIIRNGGNELLRPFLKLVIKFMVYRISPAMAHMPNISPQRPASLR